MSERALTGYPSIDKPWLKYYEPGIEKTPIPELSIYQMIKRNNSERLDSIALDLRNSANDYKKGIEITYRQFFTRIEDIARSYAYLGLSADDIVITLLPNIPESRMLIYGLNILGVTVYPVSPMIAAPQIRQIISECNAKHVAVFAGFFEKFSSVLTDAGLNSILYITGMESAPKPLQILGKMKSNSGKTLPRGNIMLWEEFDKLKKKVAHDITPYYHPDHVAVIVGTSGTTGIFADENAAKQALSAACTDNLSESDIPLDWVFVDEFPRNLGGKIDSKLLVQLSGIHYMAATEQAL